MSSVPTLKNGTQWLTGAKDKADVFADVFASKSELPPEFADTPFFGLPDAEYDDFITFRSRFCKTLLKDLDVKKAKPFTLVCRRLLQDG